MKKLKVRSISIGLLGLMVFCGNIEAKKSYKGDQVLNPCSEDMGFISVDEEKSNRTKKVYQGPQKFRRKTIDYDIEVNGPTAIIEATVKNVTVEGPLRAKASTLGVIEVDGPVAMEAVSFRGGRVSGSANIESTSTKKNFEVNGPFRAVSCKLGELRVSGPMTILEDTQVRGDIIVGKNEKNPGAIQVLVLQEETRIEGSITFESGKGVVKMEDSVKIKGEIIGGVVR